LSIKIQGIRGKIPLSEDFEWNGKTLRFAQLIHQNPFERVDFERVQPLIHSSEAVEFKEMSVDEKKYGPFQGFFAMKQNMVFAHKFDLKMGQGQTYGEFYLDYYPKSLQFGLLSRLTRLDLGEILPKRYLISTPQGDQRLSGRSGFVMNLNTGSIDGRVDITEIGASQLITLINAMDPHFENEKANRARLALNVAAPSFVQMDFQNGYMDLDIRIRGINLPVRGLSISPWTTGATADLVKSLQEGPLQ
jgi:hypothetical protein